MRSAFFSLLVLSSMAFGQMSTDTPGTGPGGPPPTPTNSFTVNGWYSAQDNRETMLGLVKFVGAANTNYTVRWYAEADGTGENAILLKTETGVTIGADGLGLSGYLGLDDSSLPGLPAIPQATYSWSVRGVVVSVANNGAETLLWDTGFQYVPVQQFP